MRQSSEVGRERRANAKKKGKGGCDIPVAPLSHSNPLHNENEDDHVAHIHRQRLQEMESAKPARYQDEEAERPYNLWPAIVTSTGAVTAIRAQLDLVPPS